MDKEMKDGTETLYRKESIQPFNLIALGWWGFMIPMTGFSDAVSWAQETIDNGAICNFHVGVLEFDFILSIRRHEDATLFRLSWPEFQPYKELY